MNERDLLSLRPSFSDGRLTNATAMQEIVAITELPEGQLLEEVPELLRGDLAFTARWADARYDDSEVGRANAIAVSDFVLLQVLSVNTEGKPGADLNGLNRSYAINGASGLIVGSELYSGATNFLDTVWATARRSV